MRPCLIAIALLVPALAHAEPKDADVSESSPDGDMWIDAKTITATASSTLCEKKPKLCHDAAQVLDDKNETAWCEGAKDDGVGSTVTLTFAQPQTVAVVGVTPLFAKSFAIAESNNRVETIEIATDAGTFTADFDDIVPYVKKHNPIKEDNDDCGDETCLSRDQRIQSMSERYASLPAPVKTSKITITITSVYKGAKYHDTCISQVDVYRAR